MYKPDRRSTLYVPFNHPNGHAGLPPVYLQVCGLDYLRDEAVLYEKVLREQGVKTEMKVYPGLPHGFWSFMPQLKVSAAFIEDTVQGFAWLLTQSRH